MDIDFENFQSHLGNTLPPSALYSIKITFEFVVISIVKDKQDKVENTIPDECFLQKVETVFEGGRQGLEMKGWIRLAANKLVSPSLFPVSGPSRQLDSNCNTPTFQGSRELGNAPSLMLGFRMEIMKYCASI